MKKYDINEINDVVKFGNKMERAPSGVYFAPDGDDDDPME